MREAIRLLFQKFAICLAQNNLPGQMYILGEREGERWDAMKQNDWVNPLLQMHILC